MKLYEIRRGQKFKLVEDPTVPPGIHVRGLGTVGAEYVLGKIDGMYSNSVGEDGYVHYFAAWTEVELVNKEKSNEGKQSKEVTQIS